MSAIATTLDVRPVSRLFKALSDPTRLRIVALLAHEELCVCHVEGALGLSQPLISRHLAVLRNAGVVSHRREGSWVYYRLEKQADPICEQHLKALVKSFSRHAQLGRDVQRLVKIRGPGSCT